MSVESYIADDLFVLRVVKNLYANPDNKWANTYEVRAIVPGSTDELLAMALKITGFEIRLHHPGVQFNQISVSTWEPDSVPYNPAVFLSFALNEAGSRTISGSPLALNKTLSVARVVPSGRQGHVFYRGVLGEGEIEAPAGKDILTNAPSMVGLVAAALVDSQADDHVGLAAAGLQLVMVTANGDNIRPLLGFIPVGVSSVPTDHAWYNRTVGP